MAEDFQPNSAEGIMRQAEVVAMHALTDQMAMVVKSTEGLRVDVKELSADLKDVRERLIKVEASNWQPALDREVARVNQAFSANSAERQRTIESAAADRRRIEDKFERAIRDLSEHHEDDIAAVRKVADDARNAYSNLTGKLLPVGSAAVIILAAIASYVVKVIH